MINSIRLWSEYYKEYVDWYDGVMFDCDGKMYYNDGVASDGDIGIVYEWCTRAYNREYKEKFGKTQNRPVFAINLSTLEVFWFQSQGEAGRTLGVNPGCISNITKGKSRTTHGYWFVNADDNAVEIAKIRLYDILGDKIKDLTVGDTDNSYEVADFVTQCVS